MNEILTQFKRVFTPEEEAQLFAPPATEAEIEELKKACKIWGVELPEVFYDFYRWHNGSRYDEKLRQFMPLNEYEVVYSISKIITVKEEWDKKEAEGLFKDFSPGTMWNKGWIPFVEQEYCWLIVFDTIGSYSGNPNQLIGFHYTSLKIKLMLHSHFEQWIKTMLELKKQNLLYLLPNDEGQFYQFNSVDDNARAEIFLTINKGEAKEIDMRQFLKPGKSFY